MNDHNARYARIRHTATGALAALAAIGLIAGTAALAAQPHARPHRHATHRHATAASGSTTKTPTSPVPGKTQTSQPAVNQQPFLNAIQQLVDNGTITATQGQTVDSQIQQGYIDPSTLTGFTPTQLQAVQQALSNTKRALGPPEPPAGGKNPTPQQGAKTPSS